MPTTQGTVTHSLASRALGVGRLESAPAAWLAAAVNPARICAALTLQVVEFSSRQLVLESCEVKRLRLRDDQGRWSGTYLLSILTLQSGADRKSVV